jgi:signal transduction histidine kinase
MDPKLLSDFYRSAREWPRNSLELNALAENLRRVLAAPFVAAYLKDPTGDSFKLGFQSQMAVLPVVIEEFIQKKILGETVSDDLQEKRISGNFLDGHSVAYHPVRSVGKSLGWVIAAYPTPAQNEQKILIIAVSQWLVGMYEKEHLDSEIQLRSQFLSIASHELKTPLTSIYGMLQLWERTLHKDPALMDPEKQLAYLRKMVRQIERLNELIDGLLDISRIQNSRFMVEPSDTDIASILRETVSSRLEPVAREAGVTLHVDAPEGLPGWVDPVRMEELVSNLGMNAIRFSPEGGIVWIRLRPDVDSFRLIFRDQGPSVLPEDRERIFRPFERAQRTARLGGLGLGLFISRQIAMLHGGNVALVESVPGKGNVFEAYFPLRKLNVLTDAG